MRRCVDRGCGMLWLDPVPLETEIGNAYHNYYTHHAGSRPGALRSLLDRVHYRVLREHVTRRYGGRGGRRSPSAALTWLALAVYPPNHAVADFPMRYLPQPVTGRILELGFGKGFTLELLKMLGWAAEGLETDPVAVAAAAERGLAVRCGALAEKAYPDCYFDAVVSSHVIEHIHDPKTLLRECHRILRPGGRLIAATPNARGLTHRVFGPAWRGLEPPRHLQIFTPTALRTLAHAAGFNHVRTIGSVRGAAGAWEFSKLLDRTSDSNSLGIVNSIRPGLRARSAELLQYLSKVLTCDLAEEIILMASR
jgi:SAM-dependent methyltransferase